MSTPIFYLFTDFSIRGPYLGQMASVLIEACPLARVINLMCDVPFANPRAGAYLLAALSRYLPEKAIVVAIVDPGVGSARKALWLNIGNRWFIAPDNGLLAVLTQGSEDALLCEFDAHPGGKISASFHGRDVFAPVAGAIACGEFPKGKKMSRQQMVGASWLKNLERIIYIDGFGNAMTGTSADSMPDFRGLEIGERYIPRAATFSSVGNGKLFCYENSVGLIEIAANKGNAAILLGLQIDDAIRIVGEKSAERK